MAILLLIWLMGGIPWKGKLLLSDAVAFRSFALMVVFAGGVWLRESWREQSRVLRILKKAGEALQSSTVRWISVGTLMLISAGLNLLQTLALQISMLNSGIYHQALWNASNGHGLASSLIAGGSFLSGHFSPSLFVLVPLFWITQGAAWTLPVVQSLLLLGGAAAWIFLAERLPGATPRFRSHLAAVTFVFILGFNSLWLNQRVGFHETAIGFASLSWALALAFAEAPSVHESSLNWIRKSLIAFLLVVSAGSTLTLLLQITPLFFLFALALRQKKQPLSAAWSMGLGTTLLLVFFWKKAGMALIPGTAVSAGSILQGIQHLFLPWIAMPLLWLGWGLQKGTRTRQRFLLALLLSLLPSLGVCLLASGADENANAPLFLAFWPVFAVLSLLALSECEARGISFGRFRIPHSVGWVWAFLSVLSMSQDPWNQMRSDLKEGVEKTQVRKNFLALPADARVVADEGTGTWLASRQFLSRWPDLSALPGECPDWIVTKPNELRLISQQGGETAYRLSRCQLQGVLQGTTAWAPVWTSAGWTAYQLRKQN
ncbi:MAG: DUF2079 domain-containing protein [Methylotenera sp.]|nr:DUF2079 domain-containing protein [Oligoflexia bacterium]